MEQDTVLRQELSRVELALARGWMNNLPLEEIAQRYLADKGNETRQFDLRTARSIVFRILTELVATAVQNDIKDAGVLYRKAALIKFKSKENTPKKVPTLEEFRQTFEHGDDMMLDDLVYRYEEAFGPEAGSKEGKDFRNAAQKQDALVRRQVQCIRDLERLIVKPISLGDSVRRWFSPALADRFTRLGLKELHHVLRCIQANPNWYQSVEGVGAVKAQRVFDFFKTKFPSLLEDPSTLPAVKTIDLETALNQTSAAALVPPYPSPAAHPLSGSIGRFSDHTGEFGALRNKHSPSAVRGQTDLEVIETWIQLKSSQATQKLYRRELGRLNSWAVQIKHKPISSLFVEDAIEYRDFLLSPPAYVIEKKGPRARGKAAVIQDRQGHDLPVSSFATATPKASSVKKSLVIISGFFNWAVKKNHVVANPFDGVKPTKTKEQVGMGSTDAQDLSSVKSVVEAMQGFHDRTIPDEAIRAVNAYLEMDHPENDQAAVTRCRFIFKLALGTGMRISELAAARKGHLRYEVTPGGFSGWILRVLGKRGKHREIPLNDALIDELRIYLGSRGIESLSDLSNVPEGTFLIGKLPPRSAFVHSKIASFVPGDGVRPQTIHLALKSLFKSVIDSSFVDPKSRPALMHASAHWLRHTAATKATAGDTPIDVISSVWGHSSLNTTSLYIHAQTERKMEEMQRFQNRVLGESSTPI